MAQHAARVDRATPQTSADMLRPALKLLGRFGLHLIAILLGLMLMLPFYWAVSSSLKQVQEVRQIPPIWLPSVPQWQNYPLVWNGRMFAGWIGNSIFLVALAIMLSVVLAAVVGHAFARRSMTSGSMLAGGALVFCLAVVATLTPGALASTTLVTESMVVIGLTPVAVIGAAVAGFVFARSESLSRGTRFMLSMAAALLPGVLLLLVNSGIFTLLGWVSNSLFLTVVATTGVVVSSSLGGYAFARFRFPGKIFLFSITMATLMLPQYVLLIPNFVLFWKIGWLNTYLPLTVPFWFGSAFFIFLFRQFFMTIPLDLHEAARIDGASYPRIFWSIILPLSGPVYATAFIIEGITQWNSFLRPFIVLNQPEMYPLSVGLRYFIVSPNDGQPRDQFLMAAAVMMTLPVILIFFIGQRYFVRGVAMTGIKG